MPLLSTFSFLSFSLLISSSSVSAITAKSSAYSSSHGRAIERAKLELKREDRVRQDKEEARQEKAKGRQLELDREEKARQEKEEEKREKEEERQLELEREEKARQEKKRKRQLELEREERARQFELDKQKREMQLEHQKHKQEMERLDLQARLREREARATEKKRRQSEGNEDEVPTGKAVGKIPKMPYFDEERDFMDSYLGRFERFAETQKWKREHWAMYLSALLKGRALDVYSRMPPEHAGDYDRLKDALLKRYLLSADGFKKRFRTAKPEAGETPSQFLTRIDNHLERWIELAKDTKSYEGLKTLIVQEQYLSTCPKGMAMHLKEGKPKTLTELGDVAENYIEAHATNIVFGLDPKLPRFRSAPSTTAHSTARRCYLCGKVGHVQSQCLSRAPDTSRAALSKLSQHQLFSQKSVLHNPRPQGHHLSFEERVNPGHLPVNRF